MKKILIIKHGALGDVVLSMHAIFSIKNHYEKPHITILTEEVHKGFFDLMYAVLNQLIPSGPVGLIGASMGGAAAIELARLNPERINPKND